LRNGSRGDETAHLHTSTHGKADSSTIVTAFPFCQEKTLFFENCYSISLVFFAGKTKEEET